MSARRLLLFFSLIMVSVAVAVAGCSRSRAPDQSAKSEDDAAREPAAARSWLVFEKSGGIAGFQFLLEVDTDGAWTVRDLARRGDQGAADVDSLEGRFTAEQTASLRDALGVLAPTDWGRFPSKVYDDFHYQLSHRDSWGVRAMAGDGQALPSVWKPIVAQLEQPISELLQRH